MGVLEKIKEIEAEMARTQKNKVRHVIHWLHKRLSGICLASSIANSCRIHICYALIVGYKLSFGYVKSQVSEVAI